MRRRWHSWALLAILYASTFLVVLPVLCRTWPYSVYYDDGTVPAGAAAAAVDDDSSSARAYLSRHRQWAGDRVHNDDISLLVTVVTVRREGRFYLSRVVARLHRLLTAGADKAAGGVLICNVDAEPELHVEAEELTKIYPVIQRRSHHRDADNLFDKEKQDYVFCLESSRTLFPNVRHIVVLEDDALPYPDFFAVTRRFVRQLEIRHPDFMYVKLFHPERLQGYIQPEPWRWFEWLALSALPAWFVTLLTATTGPSSHRSGRTFVFFLVYFVVLTGCLGRQHLLLSLRRWTSAYSLLSATECCTPAMLYSHSSAGRVAKFLSSVTCRPGYAKDTALYLHIKTGHETAFVVEPNLVEHIGLQSTLRGRS